MSSTFGTPRRRVGSLIVPLILIGLGAVLLLQNVGLLRISIWQLIWRLWPLVMVLIGIELLIGRRAPRLTTLLLVLIAGGAIVAAVFSLQMVSRIGTTVSERITARVSQEVAGTVGGPRHVAEPLQAAERADLELRFGAGELRLSPLPATSDLLIAGELIQGAGREPPQFLVERSAAGTAAAISIRSGSGRMLGLHRGEAAEWWNLQLSPKIPLTLALKTGASALDLDLTHLQVVKLAVELGAADAQLRLPLVGRTAATVKAGAANITVVIPPETPARIRMRGGLSDLDVDESRFPQVESRPGSQTYESPGFDSAPNRVDLEIKAGLAHVTVR